MGRSTAILEVPYHFGVQGVGIGAGPAALIAAGADQVLGGRRPAEVWHIALRDKSCEGEDAVVDLCRQIRIAVRQAAEQEVLPVVLAGNCCSALGTVAGLEPMTTGIVWVDAHPDFHTPATSRSGSLDGMALAAVTGHCHEELRARIGFATPVRDEDVCLLGTRDIEPGEKERLKVSGISQRFPEGVEAVYLHLDLDFLCLADAPGVHFRGPGGATLEEACALVRRVKESVPLAAVAITNFNPELDVAGRTVESALRLLAELR